MARDHPRASHRTVSPLESKRREISAATAPTMVATATNAVFRTARIACTAACYPRRVDFRKTYYILPNLFTLSCVLSGFTSLSLSASGRSEADLYLAALAICFGFF